MANKRVKLAGRAHARGYEFGQRSKHNRRCNEAAHCAEAPYFHRSTAVTG